MAYTVENLLKIAQNELGYYEKASNSSLDSKTANIGSNNWTKYARDLAAAGYYNGNKNGYAWCDVFVDWCFYQLCGKNAKIAQGIECQTGDLGAGTPYSAQYYKNQGRYDNTPKVGDQIFFKNSGGICHTGIVEGIDGEYVNTIEGNTNNMVARRSYRIGSSSIAGYGHPKYETNTNTNNTSTETKTTYKGIDVSVWNGDIDWKKVKAAGIDFAIIRAGYGKNNLDSKFKNNAKNAVAAGVDVGFYWFSYAVNAAEAKAEANYLCDAIESIGAKPTYPLCYDYEYDSVDKAKAKGYNPTNAEILAMGKAFLDQIKVRGYKTANYTNIDFLNRGFSSLTNTYDTWLAQWDASKPSRDCTIWQYSSKGKVDGISGIVDMNISYVDYAKKKNEQIPTPTVIKEEESPIKTFQTWINKNSTTQIVVDGKFGPQSKKAAVKILQTYLNTKYGAKLAVDGYYGALSQAAFSKAKINVVKGSSEKTLVYLVQGMLYAYGYSPAGFDGIFGSGTFAALKKFQSNKGIVVDGEAGPQTFKKMFA